MLARALLLAPLLALASGPAPVRPAALSTGPVTVAVSTATALGPIDPRVYGVNFGSASQQTRLRFPLRRMGGNAVTRYSWQLDAANRGRDWFFMNVAEATPDVAALPDGSAADTFVAETRAGGGDPVIQLPLIGWTPKSREKAWGFSVAKYGAQTSTECTYTGFASWCSADAGDGFLAAGGAAVTGNDPADTSVAVAEPFVTGWVAHLSSRFGSASAGGVRLYALDNEPALWSSTHRDVHPAPVTYDELWSRTASYGAAVKAAEPGAKLLGPVAWGWCEYFHSAADGCAPGADQAAHGGVPLLSWYLDQVCAYQRDHGVRLVDYLDVHYYPQGGTALSADESASAAALRLRALKELYDPAYVSESWINAPVQLLPRLRALIAAHCPGIGLSVSEYNLGDGDGPSAVLAQAEALAIFGRERLDLAARWTAPPDGSRLEDAFALYLDYDGAGSRVVGDALAVMSGDADRLGAYAVHAAGDRLLLLLFNKDTAAVSASVSVDHALEAPAAVYGFEADTRLGARGAVTTTGTTLTVDVPARSARLVVATLQAAPPPPPPPPATGSGGSGGGCSAGQAGALAFAGLALGALAARRRRRG